LEKEARRLQLSRASKLARLKSLQGREEATDWAGKREKVLVEEEIQSGFWT
jgi:tRNA A37 methylthiotransferase MiaB